MDIGLRIWATLCDVDGDGLVQLEEVDEFFDLADTDGNGELDAWPTAQLPVG